MTLILVAIGGAFGALSRYGLERILSTIVGPTFWTTMVINASGSFVLGVFISLSDSKFEPSSNLRLLIAVGFLASYTTFSTLTVTSVKQFIEGDIAHALINIIASLVVGLCAALLGLLIGKSIL